MKLEDLLRHIADNIENNRDEGADLFYRGRKFQGGRPDFSQYEHFSLAPHTHVVNGFTVPAPMDMPCELNIGDEFIFIHPIRGTTKWIYSESSKSIVIDGFNRGVFFKSTNEAELNRLAQQGIDPCSEGEE